MSRSTPRGTRRQLLTSMVAAPFAAAAATAATSKKGSARITGPMPEGFRSGALDLTKPLDNLVALLKLQADLSGRPVYSGFPGKAWGWVPDEGNTLLFNTYGIGASRLEYSPEDKAFRFIHREALRVLEHAVRLHFEAAILAIADLRSDFEAAVFQRTFIDASAGDGILHARIKQHKVLGVFVGRRLGLLG